MTRTTLVTLAASICIAGVTLTGCDNDNRDAAVDTTPSIKVFPVIHKTVTDTETWFGYLKGKMDTDIHPRVSGFLTEQLYKDGQSVKEGDILFRIDPELFEAELHRAQADLQVAEASLTAAQVNRDRIQTDVTRYQQLVKTHAVSEKDLSDAEHNLRAADADVAACKATVEQSRASVNKAQINLDYTVIRAPFSGIVGTALASKGDLVSPATKLTNMTAVDPIRVDFSLNGDHLVDAFRRYGDVESKNERRGGSPPFRLLTENGDIFPHAGRLLAMESKVDSTGMINVEGEIDNPEHILRAGMPVRILIETGQKEALLVPGEALRQVLRNNFIIVVDRENVPHMVPVCTDGEYEVEVAESNGYTSTRKLTAIKGLNGNLNEIFASYGYEKPEDVQVVTDAANGVRAMNISAANSRLTEKDAPKQKIKTEAFTFRPDAPADMATEQQEKKAATAQATLPAYPVHTIPLLQRDVAVEDEWFGTLRGVEETAIRPKVSGFLLSQSFRDGTLVQKGDVLFRIDPAPYQALLDEARANLSAAQAGREQAVAKLDMSRKDCERYRNLSRTSPGAVSEKTVTDAETEVKANEAALLKADANIARMQAAVRQAEINLGYTTITAPFDGRAGIRKASVGALVSAEDAEPLVTLSSVNPIRVDFQLSGKSALLGLEQYSATTAAGTEKPEFDIILKDGSTYPAKGKVVAADNALSTTTGTLNVTGLVENVDGGLRSGMPVRVRAGLKMKRGAYLVPARAPLNAGGRDLLLLLKPDNTPVMLPITKGELVSIAAPDNDGNETLQPMQIVDVDRETITGLILSKAQAPNLESVVLGAAGVSDWGDLLLKKSGEENYRALAERQAGSTLPDDAPAQAGVADWKALILKQSKARSFRSLVLRQAGATDEADLIAAAQGYNSLMEMVLCEMGFEKGHPVPVIAEGTISAAQVFKANQAAGAGVNKLAPTPFRYKPTRTVVDSVTAESNNH